MSNLYSELENLYDQDVLTNEEKVSVLDWLIKHRQDIVNIEIDYLNSISNAKEKIAELEAKLAEKDKQINTYAKEIVFLDNKLENLNKEFELAQEHNEKTVEYWQNECSQLKQQLEEKERYIEEQEFAEYKEMFYATQELKEDCELKILELEKQLADKEKEIEKHKADTVTFTPKLVNNAELILQIIESNRVGIDFLKQSQNQTAIAELEKVKDFIIKNNEPTRKMTEITRFINQQINDLRSE